MIVLLFIKRLPNFSSCFTVTTVCPVCLVTCVTESHLEKQPINFKDCIYSHDAYLTGWSDGSHISVSRSPDKHF